MLVTHLKAKGGLIRQFQLHPATPPGLTPGNLPFFMDGKFPGTVTLKLLNAQRL